ncbi:MAG: HDOD domain-containing protein [Myxococcota bacterium]
MDYGRGGKRKTDPGYGQGRAAIAWDDDVFLDEEKLTAHLLEVFQAPSYRPPTLPGVAMELMGLSQKPDVEFDEIVALLEQDAMLAGKIMKVMQSPIYRTASPITSLKAAVTRLGLNTLRDIVVEIAMHLRVFRCDAFADTMERTRRHSTATAHLARIVCRYTALEGEYAFLCGLLHDIGIAGILIALAEGVGRKDRPDLISIWPAIDRAHAEAGRSMCGLWELPAEIQMVVGAHHQVLIEGYAHPLAATVCLADDLSHELGFGVIPREEEGVAGRSELESACLQSHTGVDRSGPKTLEQACAALQIGDKQMELIRRDAEELRDQLA